MAAKFPLINGKLHSYASCAIDVGGTPFYGVKSLNFKQSLKKEAEFGPSPVGLGWFVKGYEASVDFEMILSEYDRLIAKLGNSYGEVPFNVGAQWIESTGQPASNVAIMGTTIMDEEQSNAPGAALVKVTCFQLTPFVRNGKTIFAEENIIGDIGSLLSGAASFLSSIGL